MSVQLIAGTYLDSDLKEMLAPFKKEPGMSWANPEGCVWFFAYIDGQPVGVCALSDQGNGRGRCKSDVVLAQARGQGVYRQLSAARVEKAKELGMRQLSAFAGPMSVRQFLNDGFVIRSIKAGGISFVVKDLV